MTGFDWTGEVIPQEGPAFRLSPDTYGSESIAPLT